MRSMKLAIIGVGAVGSYIGAYLTKEGFDITLIDMWGNHVESMNENGNWKWISDHGGPITVTPP